MPPSEKQRFLENWEREAAVTMKVLRNYPAAKGDLKPSERSKDAKDLAWTFVFEGFGASQAAEGEFKFPPPDMPPKPGTWDAVVNECERGFRFLADKVRQADDAFLNTTVKAATGPKQRGDVRRLDFLWQILMDQVHHRGQFTVYLRMAGGKVPSIYGPSADEPWS
ncbi:MAG TPA: DinB family protein [Gemmatimonadales bacterium]|nr:DinB family protein [Gemmatimonadales bacterium]